MKDGKIKISVIIIGEEIISGLKQDKNFAYVGQKLYLLGTSLMCQIVGDRKEDLKYALENAEKVSEIIICSGGLGSTEDDITRYVAAEYFNLILEENKDALAEIEKKYMERTGRKPGEEMKIQGTFPRGAKPIPNMVGSAFGFLIERNNKKFFFLPGVPAEFSQMFDEYVLPEIIKYFTTQRYEKFFKIFGATETYVESVVKSVGIPEDLRVSYLPKFPEVLLRITGEREKVEWLSSKLKNILGGLIYSENPDDTLPRVLGRMLMERKITISTAESLTGGELANMITDVPGSSLYFKGGEVVYSNQAKVELGVRKGTIERFGAVSHECAKELAERVREKYKTDVGISTTGVAGPDQLEGKPPGLFYIGICIGKETESFKFMFNIGRKNVKILASYMALKILKDKIT